jgi:hypothetical protein
MVVYDTIAKLHAAGYTLMAYCRICERHAKIDLAALVASGRGYLGIRWRPRCGYCREPGLMTLQPPAHAHSHANGWISPPNDGRPAG